MTTNKGSILLYPQENQKGNPITKAASVADLGNMNIGSIKVESGEWVLFTNPNNGGQPYPLSPTGGIHGVYNSPAAWNGTPGTTYGSVELMAVFDGTKAAQIVRALAKISSTANTNNILHHITGETTSYIQRMQLVNEVNKLMEGVALLYREPCVDGNMDIDILDIVEKALREKKSILMGIDLPQGGIHHFVIEHVDKDLARILHDWQERGIFRAEKPVPIKDMTQTLNNLFNLRQDENEVKLRKTFGKLFGQDNAQLSEGTAKERVRLITIFEGTPKESLTSPTNQNRFAGLSRVSADLGKTRVSSISNAPSEIPETGNAVSEEIEKAVAIGLGLVFGAGGSFPSDKVLDKIGLFALKAALKRSVRAIVEECTVPTFARLGVSVLRANVAAGLAMFGIFAIWDVFKWKMNDITAVNLRQRLAEGAGAAGFGTLGSAGAGFALGMWLGPIGMGAGVILGGVIGGIAGMFVGKGIDYAIWDHDEDAAMESYEFFGWHDVDRNTRPIKSPEEIQEKYDKKLMKRPKKITEEDWGKICLGTYMILVKAMYPFFEDLMKLAKQVKETKSEVIF